MKFEEHVAKQLADHPVADLTAAEDARAAEIEAELRDDAGTRKAIAAKAAKHERAAWESATTNALRKQFGQELTSHALFGLDVDVLVPLGGNDAVRLGDMNEQRIAIRRDMRLEVHRRENRAFESEMSFWDSARGLLGPGQTINDYLNSRS